MAKRLNDTASMPLSTGSSESEYHSRDVRKIDNGYVVRESYSGPKGHESKELYSEEHPDKHNGVVGGSSHSNAMKAAVQFMNKC